MIKEIQLIPYPRKFWIVKDESLKNLEKEFNLSDDQKDLIKSDTFKALELQITKKCNDHIGYMVILTDDSDRFSNIHESIHVVLDMYSDLGMEVNYNMDQEPFTYYIEYIFKLLENETNNR